MKNNEQAPGINTEDEKNQAEQRAQKKFGESIAKEFGIDYAGEFFEIPHHDDTGREIKRTRVHAWKEIPFWSEDGGEIVERADIKDVIKAIMQYPDMELREAITRIRKAT
ncbi:MAG: hypothetical protein HYT28_03870 [Parcubacteria group bacterium]|nr:hypothetical protein [Parcubacteria group bacterium]